MSEKIIQREIMCALSDAGCTIWRNNTGQGWQGNRKTLRNAKVQFLSGLVLNVDIGILLTGFRPVSFGLCVGSSDLIGIKPLVITEQHVGKTIAQFLAVETKAKRGVATKEQKTFIDHIRSVGGIGIIAKSLNDIDFL